MTAYSEADKGELMAANENIKGITIQIGGDVSDLNKALEQAADKTKFLQDELKAVNNALKLDPDNVDLLKKKFDILEKTIANCEPKVEDLRKEWEKAREDFKAGNISQTEFDRITQELNSGEKELDIYKGQLETTKKKLDDMDDSAGDVADSIEEVAKSSDDGKKSMDDLSFGEITVAANMKTIITTAVELIRKLADFVTATDPVLRKSDELTKKIKEQKQAYEDDIAELEHSSKKLEFQAKLIGDLDKKLGDNNTTEAEAKKIKQELAREVEAFNKSAGETVLVIDKQTGALDNNSKSLQRYLDMLKKKAVYNKSYDRLMEVYTEIAEKQEVIQDLEARRTNAPTWDRVIGFHTNELNLLDQEKQKLEGIVLGYTDVETSVTQLSDAMAYSLLNAEARGAELSTLQQEELAGWKETHQQEVDDFNATIQKESELHDARLQKTKDTNHEINLNYETSLEERARILKHNQEIVTNYESNLHTLLQIALAQDDEDAKQAMLNYINTLTDYSEESMAIADQMVKDFGETGGEQAWALINGWNQADVPGQFKDIGMEIDKATAEGIKKGESQVTSAAQTLASKIRGILKNIKVNYTLSGSAAQNNWSFRPMAQGGIVTQPTFTLTGEAGPEAIIPLDRLGGIIESALGNSGGISGGYTMNVYPQSMSPSEQEMLLDKFDRRFGDRTSRRTI